MPTFLMRIYDLFFSPNKILSLINKMLSHTIQKHRLSGTYCFAFVKEQFDPFIFDSHAYFAHFKLYCVGNSLFNT
jgi:hypothetical protein